GPAVRLLTEFTPSMLSISCVSFWIRPRYRDEEISRDDTVRISSGRDGKCCSIFLDSRNPGTLVEKKKISTTTGLRSTNAAPSTNNPTVMASISQCAPNQLGLLGAVRFIASASDDYANVSALDGAPPAT